MVDPDPTKVRTLRRSEGPKKFKNFLGKGPPLLVKSNGKNVLYSENYFLYYLDVLVDDGKTLTKTYDVLNLINL